MISGVFITVTVCVCVCVRRVSCFLKDSSFVGCMYTSCLFVRG